MGLIHATANALAPIREAFQILAPDLAQLHFMDEGLLPAFAAAGGLDPGVGRRFLRLLTMAEESGVDVILLTCTAFGPLVPALRPFVRAPMLRADTPMLEAAVLAGRRIAVVATVAGAVPNTRDQLLAAAAAAGRTVELAVEVVPDAFEALNAGRPGEHDALVAAAARRLAPGADALVLAQFSMARAAPLLAGLPVPVLTSPGAAVAAVRRLLGEGGAQ